MTAAEIFNKHLDAAKGDSNSVDFVVLVLAAMEEYKSISEGEVKEKAVAFARHMNIVDITYPSHSKTMSIEQIYDYWITNIYK